MTNTPGSFPWKICASVALACAGVLAGVTYTMMGGRGAQAVHADEGKPKVAIIPVKTVLPVKGIERKSVQPGSIQAYESVRLYAKVPGFLKWQTVDIGDRVKAGDKLAVVDVPEIETQVQRTGAVLKQAKKRVHQMKARVKSAIADEDAAKAAVTQSEAAAKSAEAWVRFRTRQHQRIKDLFRLKSIEEQLVDESKERFEASLESERAAQAAIVTSKSHLIAANSKIEVAEADVDVADAEVDVAKAEHEKYKVQLGFATITSPFDGVITHRTSFVGDFVRSANEGSGNEPLLTVQRTDKMRVVVQLPDRDVPYADPGDAATVQIDALGGKTLVGKISRVAQAEDPQTRLMRVEIDLPNPKGEICHGMYGRVTITLDRSPNQLAIPSACLVGRTENGIGSVYVVRDKLAHLVKVDLGIDNGLSVGILRGLNPQDEVILQPGNALYDGAPVNPAIEDEGNPNGGDH